jgi:hypothetical protein
MEEGKELVVMSMKLRPEVAEKVKYLAKKADLKPARFLANLVETVLPDLLVCETLGVFKIAVLIEDLKTQMKAWSDFVRDEPGNVIRSA